MTLEEYNRLVLRRMAELGYVPAHERVKHEAIWRNQLKELRQNGWRRA